MSSDEIPAELPRTGIDEKELHSYTKLAIACTGIGLGLYVLFFSAGAINILSFFGLQNAYTLSSPVAVGMIALMIATNTFSRKAGSLAVTSSLQV